MLNSTINNLFRQAHTNQEFFIKNYSLAYKQSLEQIFSFYHLIFDVISQIT